MEEGGPIIRQTTDWMNGNGFVWDTNCMFFS
jgi:hypothetical protein